MRVIERRMVDAIKRKVNFKLDNTAVQHYGDGRADVFLYDRLIASVNFDGVYVCDGDYDLTHTTKSRVNAILSEFVEPCAGVFTRKGTNYITYFGQVKNFTGSHWIFT